MRTPHITAPSLEDVQRAASFQGLLLADLEHEVRATFQGITKARWSKPVDITEIIDWLADRQRKDDEFWGRQFTRNNP